MDEYVFEQAKTHERFKKKALNSDLALSLCLKETGWDVTKGILYLGRASAVESPDTLKARDEIKYIPGT